MPERPAGRLRSSMWGRLPAAVAGGSILLLIAAGLSACAPAPTPPLPGVPVGFANGPALAAELAEEGVDLTDLGEASYVWFESPARTYEIGDQGLQVLFVHEFSDATAAQAAARRVSPDGRRVIAPDGSEILVEWLGEPHVFLSGRLLVVYVGTDLDTLQKLSDALGPQFAGA